MKPRQPPLYPFTCIGSIILPQVVVFVTVEDVMLDGGRYIALYNSYWLYLFSLQLFQTDIMHGKVYFWGVLLSLCSVNEG